MNRRHFLAAAAAFSSAPLLTAAECPPTVDIKGRRSRIGVSSYSFWGFKREDLRPINVCIEHAYQFGIPTMRVNSGTWGTSKSFDELTAIPKSLELLGKAFAG